MNKLILGGQKLGIIMLCLVWFTSIVCGQVVDTIPYTGHDTVHRLSGVVVPTTNSDGYCLTNSDGSLTLYPQEGCGIRVTGSYLLCDFYYGENYKDYIRFYNGVSTTSPLLASVTGAGYVDLVSTGPLTIRFTTNSIFQYNGFHLHYFCVTDCSGNNTQPSDTEPDCIDMRNLNASNIAGTYGAVNNPYSITGIHVQHHKVILNQTFDPYTGGLLSTLPDNEPYSIKLGNPERNEGESLSYTFIVDTNEADIILLKYAPVLELPNHTPSLQPRFDMEILDNTGNIIDQQCGQALYIASQSLGWTPFQYRDAKDIYNATQPRYNNHEVLWKDWTGIGFYIAPYHGMQITIRLTTRDCGEGLHFGYAYFHLGCMKGQLVENVCGETDSNTFTAPAGFNYSWHYQDEPGIVIGTEQSVTVPMDTSRVLVCQVNSLENNSCAFTLYGSVRPIQPKSRFTIERDSCTRRYLFHNNSIISNGTATPYATECETAVWDFGDGTTSQDYNTTHTYAQPGRYTVSLISSIHQGECTDTLRQELIVPVDTTEFWETQCDEYVWNGQSYTASGDYTQYIPRSGQCDSMVTLHLTIHPSYHHYDTISICGSELPLLYGDSVFQIETRTGDYPVTFTTANGCDSLVDLHLTVNPPYSTRDTIRFCDDQIGSGIPYGDSVLTTSGEYSVHFLSGQGCDSSVLVTFIVNPAYHRYDTVVICDNELPYSYADTLFTNETPHLSNYQFHFFTQQGCDSLLSLCLTVNSTYHHTDTLSICGADLPLQYGDTLFPIETRTGDYPVTFTTANGCDSLVDLHLTVNPPYSTRDTVYVCENRIDDGYAYGDSLLRHFGDHTVRFTSVPGCDSSVVVSVIPWPIYHTDDTIVLCDNDPDLLYGDSLFPTGTPSGNYPVMFTAKTGCDSLVTLHLIVNPTYHQTDTLILCDNDFPKQYGDSIFPAGTITGSYPVMFTAKTGCDSLVDLHLIVNPTYHHADSLTLCADELPYTYGNHIIPIGASTGIMPIRLSSVHGCDSLVDLYLTIHSAPHNTVVRHICRNELPYNFAGHLFPIGTNSGTFVIQDTTAYGCDSITTLTLFVHDTSRTDEILRLHLNQLPSLWHGHIIPEGASSGSDFLHLNSTQFPYCDSIVELHLTIYLEAQTSTGINTQCTPDPLHPCNGFAAVHVRGGLPPYSYSWNDQQAQTTDTAFHLCAGDYTVVVRDSLGQTITVPCHVDNYVSPTISYSDTIGVSQLPYSFHQHILHHGVNDTLLVISNPQGCDSNILYSLHIYDNITEPHDTTVCPHDFPFTWFGRSITERGTIQDTSLLENLSYRIRVFHTDTFATQRTHLYDTACAPYLWHGQSCDSSGLYTHSLPDSRSCDSILILHLTIIDFPNPISNIQLPTICVGDTGIVTIGHQPNHNVYIASEEDASISLSETIFLPDGQDCNGIGCSYQSSIHFSNFPAQSIIRDVNDILYVRLNLEHSYAGDLYIKITCPNLQSADILKFSRSNYVNGPCIANIGASHRGWQGGNNAGTGTYFGLPGINNNDNPNFPCSSSHNPPGTGYNYCWSNNTTQGYTYGNTASPNDNLIYRSANAHYMNGHRTFYASNIANGTHFYNPDESFQSLTGCPLNGDWIIEVIDGWEEDNGYLFSWEIALDPELLNVPTFPIDSIVLTGTGASQLTDSTYRIIPPENITSDTELPYLVTVYGDRGCRYDTVVMIQILAPVHTMLTDTVCFNELPYCWGGDTVRGSGTHIMNGYRLTAANGCDSTVSLQLTVLDTTHSVVTEQIGERDFPHIFNGTTLHHAVTDTLIIVENHHGCDSLIHYTLTVFDNTEEHIDTIVCPEALPIQWHGHWFTLTNSTATDTIANAHNSNHIIHYSVHAHPAMVREIHSLPDICVGSSFTFTIGTSNSNDIRLSYLGVTDSVPTLSNLILSGLWISGQSGQYTITPSTALTQDTIVTYQLTAWNQLGCRYDTAFQIQIPMRHSLTFRDTICHEALPYIYGTDTIHTVGTHSLTPEIRPGSQGDCDTIVNRLVTVLDSINPITSVNIPDICAGDTSIITIGYSSFANIQLFQHSYTIQYSEPIFLPDDLICPPFGNSYRSDLYITNASPGAVIRNVEDILFVRLLIEHSAIEDLRILVGCPSGNTSIILPNEQYDSWAGGFPQQTNPNLPAIGRINLGVANRLNEVNSCNASENPIGIPWNYVWSNTTTLGYSYAGGTYGYIHERANINLSPNPLWDGTFMLGNTSYKVDSSNLANMSQIYHPEQSFQSLVGCPVEGNWYIQIEDLETYDNGYLTEWELSLSPDLYRDRQNVIIQCQLRGPWTENLTDSTFRITPPATLTHDTLIYDTLTLINAYGCRYDTLIGIQILVPTHSDITASACDSFRWHDSTYTTSGNYAVTMMGSNGCDSTVTLHLTIHSSQCDTLRLSICQGDTLLSHGFNIPATRTQTAGILYDSLRLTASNGCDSLLILKLTIEANPTLVTCADTIVEAGGTAHLWATGAQVYVWSPTGMVTQGNAGNATATPLQSMYFNVTGQSGLCHSRDSVRVLVREHQDSSICSGALPFIWNGVTFPDTTPRQTILPNPDGLDRALMMHLHLYPTAENFIRDTVTENQLPHSFNGISFNEPKDTLFTLTDRHECDSLVHYSLSVRWNSIDTLATEICSADLPYIWFDTALYNSTTIIRQWTVQDGSDSVIIFKLTVHNSYDTTYHAEVCEGEAFQGHGFTIEAQETYNTDTVRRIQHYQTADGCDSILRLNVVVVQTHPVISSLTGDFCNESYDILSVGESFNNYRWSTGESTPSIVVQSPGVYSVTVTNGDCSGGARYKIEPCVFEIHLPNAITPGHADGLNDYFCLDERARNMIADENFNIRIFDRWGQLVFYSDDKYFRWGGDLNGIVSHNNVYIYKITCSDRNGDYHTIKGSITVL